MRQKLNLSMSKFLKSKGFNEPCKTRTILYKNGNSYTKTNRYATKCNHKENLVARPYRADAIQWLIDNDKNYRNSIIPNSE